MNCEECLFFDWGVDVYFDDEINDEVLIHRCNKLKTYFFEEYPAECKEFRQRKRAARGRRRGLVKR